MDGTRDGDNDGVLVTENGAKDIDGACEIVGLLEGLIDGVSDGSIDG